MSKELVKWRMEKAQVFFNSILLFGYLRNYHSVTAESVFDWEQNMNIH